MVKDRIKAAIKHAWEQSTTVNIFYDKAAEEILKITGENLGFIVGDGKKDTKFRTMVNGYIEWTDNVNEAIRFARRVDAENFCQHDEDAWQIIPVCAGP